MMERGVILAELGRAKPDLKLVRAMVISSARKGGLSLNEDERRLLWSALLDAKTGEMQTENRCGVEEIRVLEADVRRTRQDMAFFRSEESRDRLCGLLSEYCLDRQTPYRQGLNEIAAPFVLVGGGFALFSEFCSRYADALYASASTSSKSTLLAACRLFGRFLGYHDPRLVLQLAEAGLSPALYATPWLLTLCARSFETIDATCRLFDLVMSLNEPAIIFAFGLAILQSRRGPLLECGASRVPEELAHAFSSGGGNSSIHKEADIPRLALLVPAAITLLEDTPSSLRSALSKSLAGFRHRQRSETSLSARRSSMMPLFSNNTTAPTSHDEDIVIGLNRLERNFWLPVPVLEATELVDALLNIPKGPLRPESIVLLDASPPGEAARLAAGRLADSVWPTMEFIAFGSTIDEGRRNAFLCHWATQRIQGDKALRDKHVIVLGTDETAPKRRRRDAIAEAFLPRDLIRRGASLVAAFKRYDWQLQVKEETPTTPPEAKTLKNDALEDVRAARLSFSDSGDDSISPLPTEKNNQTRAEEEDNEELSTDAVALLVATALRDAGVSRVSSLERGGFEKLVYLAKSRNVLDKVLPQFDPEYWLAYEEELRRGVPTEQNKPTPPQKDPEVKRPPNHFRRFQSGLGGKPRWATWTTKVSLGHDSATSLSRSVSDSDPRCFQHRKALVIDRVSPNNDDTTDHRHSSYAIKFNSADFLDDNCFDEAYF